MHLNFQKVCNFLLQFRNKKYLQMLAEYCNEHQLTPISPLYVTSLCDYWLTGDTDKYIYKLELQIK